MSSFDWKENIEDSIKDGLIITITTTGIFYALNVRRLMKSTKGVHICHGYHELAGRIIGRVLAKNYAVYKKWIKK